MDKTFTAAKSRLEKAEQLAIARERKMSTDSQNELAYAKSISLYVNYLADVNDLSENQKRFLGEYCKDGLIGHACYRAGVSITAYYYWCKQEKFKDMLEEARKIANESLEKLALDLSNGTYSKPVVSAGHLVTEERIYDTRMLAMLLKSRMPERYAQKIDVTSAGQPLVKLVDKATWESI